MSTKHYVNNGDLYRAMVDYRQKYKQDESTKISDYIGVCIMQICTRLSSKPNFSGYSYKDEMVSDGIENCLAAVKSFNPDKSKNPFAYFTQIAWNAFIRRITKEKKEVYIKHKNMVNLSIMQAIESSGEGAEVVQANSNEVTDEVINSFESKLTKSKKSSTVGLEKFVEGTDA